MGRKSMLGSTEKKKKSTAKKKAAPKKSVKASVSKEKDLRKQGKPKKDAAKSKPVAKPKSVAKTKGEKVMETKPKPKAKPKSVAKTKEKKVAAVKKPMVSIRDLLFKKFDVGAPERPVAASAFEKKRRATIPEAPPFVTGYNEEETKRIRAMLFKKFDLKGKAPVEAIKEAPSEGEAVAMPPPVEERVPEYQPAASVSSGGPEPMAKGIKVGLWALVVLMAIIIGTSFSNRAKFYLKDVDGVVQVWRGKFAPAGEELLLSLDGIKTQEPRKDVYTREEICPIVFSYFQDKADAVLDEPRGPDFGKIKVHLFQAASYAPTKELREKVRLRLKSMDFIVLFHKADIAFGRGTLPDLEAARAYLDRAGTYASSDFQRELLVGTRAVVDSAFAAMRAQ
ncbi:MAG: hypothetical protein KAV87_33660 [Desulfobacteraceae bacterium]|nr:hypothetical protein [Desulfobacteraceae bacterium]